MNSVNSSLLESSSVFIQLPEEEVIQQATLLRGEEIDNMSQEEFNISHNNPQVKHIHMTEKEAFRLLNLAASLLQANIRRYFQQKFYKEELRQHKAASKIQALWRGYRTRYLDVGLYRKKHDYITKLLQQQIDDIQSSYSEELNKVQEQQKFIVDFLLTMSEELQEMKQHKVHNAANSLEMFDQSPEIEKDQIQPADSFISNKVRQSDDDDIKKDIDQPKEAADEFPSDENIIKPSFKTDIYVGDLLTCLDDQEQYEECSNNNSDIDIPIKIVDDFVDSLVEIILSECITEMRRSEPLSLLTTQPIPELGDDPVCQQENCTQILNDSLETSLTDRIDNNERECGMLDMLHNSIMDDSLDAATNVDVPDTLKDIANLNSIEIEFEQPS